MSFEVAKRPMFSFNLLRFSPIRATNRVRRPFWDLFLVPPFGVSVFVISLCLSVCVYIRILLWFSAKLRAFTLRTTTKTNRNQITHEFTTTRSATSQKSSKKHARYFWTEYNRKSNPTTLCKVHLLHTIVKTF